MRTRFSVLAVLILGVLAGCNVVNRVVKDIPIQERDKLGETYIGKEAWTRALLIDLRGQGVVDRDAKVEIVDLDLHWNGSVTVQSPNRHRITHNLGLERPLTMAAVEEKLNKLFWFTKPEYRYRMNLRKYGKKTAKAVFEHQLFKGMQREAALESWGYPDEMKSNELSGRLEEQWIYKDIRQKNKKRYVYVTEGTVDHWEE
ncbi:MAG: hypothetical protein PHD74_01720 [Candidatus Krumholzibacteria bacterium]|nr:hypothetical protein [Candidatus Krumholzibacteria bacterium]